VKYGYKRIFSNGHPLVMGYGCESNNSTYFHLGKSPHYEGVREKDGENDFIAFYSGTWSYLFGPNAEYDTTNAEYAYYILGEATIKGYIAVGPMNGYFTDKASLYVNTTGAVGAIHSAYKIGNGSVDIYLDKGEVGTVNANSFSGGNGDVLSVYLSDCKITGLLNGDSQSSFDETHLYLSENAKINCKYTEFDKTDKTYKYSSSPYDAINAKVEAMKNDFLAEKPADPSEGEEEENKDPEGEAPSTGNVTDEKEEEKNIFLEISAEYETVLIIVTAVFTLAMIVIVIVKLIPKKKK